MGEFSQAGRPFRVDTPLAPDTLLLQRFTGEEGVSVPYHYTLELLSEDDAVDPAGLLRQPVVITVQLADGEERKIHGLVQRFAQLGQQDDLTFYQAEVVPWLWFLTLSSDCKVFQNKSVLDIVQEVFQGLGYDQFEVRCSRSYAPREYCVQYRETHFNFVSRLLEEEGIFYFFEHTQDTHTLVLTDVNSTCQPCPGQEEATVAPTSGPTQEEDRVTSIALESAVHLGRVTLRDYDFTRPSLNLESSADEDETEEHYDYPGLYRELDDGTRYAQLLLEEGMCGQHVIRGAGNCRAFASGFTTTLREHYRSDANRELLLVQVSHRGEAGDYRSWDTALLEYENSFVGIPADTPFRPPRRSRKPRVHGSQTAVVVGPAGEEVFTDQYGRIKIQFFWDRLGQRDQNSSCFVRVLTPWGGRGYGSVSIPRIGNEVVVDFLEGDADRPIVTGSVYNAEQTVPFELPGSGIQMGMKSRSSPGGGGDNEISMTDTAGEELINIHAQHDMTTTVEHDQTLTVNDGNRTVTIKSGTLTETVKGDTTLTVQAGARTVSVTGGDYSATSSDAIVLYGKGKGVSIKGDSKGVGIIGNGEGVGIEGNGGGVGIKGNDKGVGIEGNGEGVGIVGNGKGVGIKGNPDFFAEGTSSAGIKAPVVDIGDKQVNITGVKITISAGASTIVLDPSGVTIQGPLVKIN